MEGLTRTEPSVNFSVSTQESQYATPYSPQPAPSGPAT